MCLTFENMPQKRHCCYVVPLRHAAIMISAIGLALGCLGCMLSGRYAFADSRLRASDLTHEEAMKKYILFAAATFSVMTIIGSILLFIGAVFKQPKYICWYIYIVMTMCMGFVIVSVAVPMACFCKPQKPCVLRSISFATTAAFYFGATVWMQVWMYFTLVASSFMKRIVFGEVRK